MITGVDTGLPPAIEPRAVAAFVRRAEQSLPPVRIAEAPLAPASEPVEHLPTSLARFYKVVTRMWLEGSQSGIGHGWEPAAAAPNRTDAGQPNAPREAQARAGEVRERPVSGTEAESQLNRRV